MIAHDCPKTFTVPMGQRAARAVYAGRRHVTPRERRMLRRIVRCQRNPRARWYVRWYIRRRSLDHATRTTPLRSAVASWYDDSGATASGWHAAYGIASLYLAFGTRVLVCFHSRCVESVVDDRGPYVAGRVFDLSGSVAAALAFDGVQTIRYRLGG